MTFLPTDDPRMQGPQPLNMNMGLLSNPYVAMGLGLLGSPTIGRGVNQGFRNVALMQASGLAQAKAQREREELEQRQRAQQAWTGTPWTNPDTGVTDPYAGGMVSRMDPSLQPFVAAMGPQQGAAFAAERMAPKPTTAMQEYDLYRQQQQARGEPALPFFDYQIEKRRAAAPAQNVNVHTGEQMSPLWDVTQPGLVEQNKSIAAGRQLVPVYETILTGLEGGQETGRVRDITRPIRQVADELGIAVDPNLPQEEQLNSAMQYLVPRMRVAGSGSTSDREMRVFAQAAPNFYNTRGGNMVIAATAIQQQRYLEREFELKQQYAVQNNGSLVGFADYAEQQLGPMFPRPQSKQEHDRLSKGTVYIAPDGQFRVKGIR